MTEERPASKKSATAPEHHPSYDPSACCGSDCYAHGKENEPCWGNVSAIDEIEYSDGDYSWVHGCEGHWDFGGKYEPAPDPFPTPEERAAAFKGPVETLREQGKLWMPPEESKK